MGILAGKVLDCISNSEIKVNSNYEKALFRFNDLVERGLVQPRGNQLSDTTSKLNNEDFITN
ncbi:MAG: hypothetical protein ACOX65_11635 [Anaerotruncus rubiinfantis]|jgi:hypothetical protein